MLKNNKGFSIVELLAVIIISSLILVPLLSAFTNTIEINDDEHTRRSAVNIAEGTLYGFNKISYTNLYNLLEAEKTGGGTYLTLDLNSCDSLATLEDQGFCTAIFTSIHNNLQLTPETFKVYLFDYNMTPLEYQNLTTNQTLPQLVRSDLLAQDVNEGSITSLIRITIWIQQNDDPAQYMILSGLIKDE